MIVYQSRFLTRGEVWFDNSPGHAFVDWIVFHQRSQPVPKAKWRPFYTRLIALSQSTDLLLAQMDGFTASDIRKAEKKDKTSCERLQTKNSDTMTDFYEFYNRFAEWKQLEPANRQWLARTADAGKLDLWKAISPDGVSLVYHALYCDRNRVRSMHIASLNAEAAGKEAQRKIGRASRCLHWNCMLYYRSIGIGIYDLGGWYNGSADPARLGINKFKEGFGGSVVCEYEGDKILTIKAWSAITAARLWGKLRDQQRSRNQCQQGTVNPEPALQGSK